MLPDYQLIRQSRNDRQYSLTAEMTLLADNIFFDGHFEGFVLLPAVAQLFIAQSIAEQIWGDLGVFQSLRQVKFRDPVYPDTTLQLQLDYDVEKNTLAFCYTQAGEVPAKSMAKSAVKSTGKIVFRPYTEAAE